MAFRLSVEGIQIEASDVMAVAALIKALRQPSVAVVTQVSHRVDVAAKRPKARMAKVNGVPHARSREGRAAVMERRQVLLGALRAGGEQLAHELSARPEMADYPKATMFNDLGALERDGKIVRGDRGYRVAEDAPVDPTIASSLHEAGSLN